MVSAFPLIKSCTPFGLGPPENKEDESAASAKLSYHFKMLVLGISHVTQLSTKRTTIKGLESSVSLSLFNVILAQLPTNITIINQTCSVLGSCVCVSSLVLGRSVFSRPRPQKNRARGLPTRKALNPTRSYEEQGAPLLVTRALLLLVTRSCE